MPARNSGSIRKARPMWLAGIACGTLAYAAAMPSHAGEAPPDVRDQLVALTQRIMDAIGEGKAEVWRQALADDAVVTDEFGRRQDKAEAVAAIRPFPPGISGSIQVRDARVRVYGDTAVIDFEDYERETYFGQQFVVRYPSTATYVRRSGEWKLVAWMDVTLPTPPPSLAVRDLSLADYPGTYRIAPDRAWSIERDGDHLVFRTKAGRPAVALDPVARDVFMGGDDEKNLYVFKRDAAGKVVELVERRKFNDLHLQREPAAER